MNKYTDDDVKKFLENPYFLSPAPKYKIYFKKNNPDLFNYVMERTNFLDESANFRERIYCIKNNIFSPVLCCNCHKNKVNFRLQTNSYSSHCTRKCSRIDKNVQIKKNKTTFDRYGPKNSEKNKEINRRRAETLFKNTGYTSLLAKPEIREKIRRTKLEKYGHEYYSNTEKRKETCLKKYGVNCPAKYEKFKEKARKTNIERYGVSNIMEVKSVRDKIAATNKKKYGYECSISSPEVHRKMLSTKYRQKYDKILKNKLVEILTPKEEFVNLLLEDPIESVFKWKCRKCGKVFESKIDRVCEKNDTYARCCKCFPKTSSIFEKSLVEVIEENYSGEIIENSRNIIKPKELDVYIPELKLAFEFDGAYWHSTKVRKNPKYHLNKTILAESNGIHLIHIFECDWIENKEKIKNILKTYINQTPFPLNFSISEFSYDDILKFANPLFLRNPICKENSFLGLKDIEGNLFSFLEFYIKNDILHIENFVWLHSRDVCFEKFLGYINEKFKIKIQMYTDKMIFEDAFLVKYGFKKVGTVHPETIKFKKELTIYNCGKSIFVRE